MPRRLSEAVLIAAAKRGDPACFEELVARHGAMVYRVSYRLLGDEEDARDCAQEAWIQVWRHLADFHGRSAFSTWLYRLTTNQALMSLRRRKPHAELDANEETAPESTADEAERALLQDAVRGALTRLSPEHKTVLVLHEFEGLTMAEVAHIVGIELPAAKQRLRRARLALAKLMTDWHPGRGGADE